MYLPPSPYSPEGVLAGTRHGKGVVGSGPHGVGAVGGRAPLQVRVVVDEAVSDEQLVLLLHILLLQEVSR